MTVNARSTRRSRIEARVHADVREAIEQAASLQGISVSDFVVRSAHDAARQVLDEHTIIRLSTEDSHVFVSALDNPPEPNDALRDAMAAYLREHEGNE